MSADRFERLLPGLSGVSTGPPDYPRVYRRVRIILRRAFNEGVGPFLLGMLLLSLAALCARIAILSWLEYNRSLAAEIAGAAAPNEPRRDDPRFGIVASVLAPVNGSIDAWRDELAEHESHRQAIAIHEATEWLVSLASELEAEFRVRDPESSAWKEDLRRRCEEIAQQSRFELVSDRWEQAGFAAAWQAGLARDLFEICSPGAVPDLEFAGYGTGTTRERAFGEVVVEEPSVGSRTTLIVPSRIVSLLGVVPGPSSVVSVGDRATGGANRPAEQTEEFGTLPVRMREAILFSRLMDRALDLFSPSPSSASEAPDYDLVQAYFISPDSVLRLWNPAPGFNSEQRFPPARLWASANYFDRLLASKDPFYLTPAYIDFSGGGIVLSRTTPLFRERHESTPGDGEPEDQILGIVCTDVRIPVDTFLEALAVSSRLLRVQRVRFPQRTGFSMEAILVRSPDPWELFRRRRPQARGRTGASPLPWVDISGGKEGRAAAEAIYAKRNERGFDHSVVPLDWEGAFLIPLSDTGDGGFEAALVTPLTPELPLVARWAGLLALFFAGFSLCFVLLGGILSRRASALSARLSILRNLQVGVLSVDAEDHIEEANDRAEEIFKQRLPKPGVRDPRAQQPKLRFSELIDPLVVLADASGQPLRAAPYEDEIPRIREEDRGSCYYARLRQVDGGWIRVFGTPILGRARRANRRTFGVVERVIVHELTQTLNGLVQKHTKGTAKSKA